MPHSDPDTRGLHIGCGAALLNQGLSSSFATQPLEWTDLRRPPGDPVSGTGCTQMLLRLGYGPKGSGIPRRPASDVLDIQP